ncbi:MAG: hypothetical protein FWE13_03340 [Firmicutes bacterium]|nr:hypothetical protein [Bacillota bacterium]
MNECLSCGAAQHDENWQVCWACGASNPNTQNSQNGQFGSENNNWGQANQNDNQQSSWGGMPNEQNSEQFAQEQRNAQVAKWATNGLYNGIGSLILAVITILVVTAFELEPLWGAMFIVVDLLSSIPAIFNGWRGRSHNKTKFIATMAMAAISIVVTIVALIILFVQ